jgi:orotidine-5'-phosphate decarboxylase
MNVTVTDEQKRAIERGEAVEGPVYQFTTPSAGPETATFAVINDTERQVAVILDAKRGDIASTAEQYAQEVFGRYAAHAVTVNPYLGRDSVEPYLAASRRHQHPVKAGRPRSPARKARRPGCLLPHAS